MRLDLLLPALLLLPLEAAAAAPAPGPATAAAQEPDGVVRREDLAEPVRPLRRAALGALMTALGDDGVEGNAEAACRELLARAAAEDDEGHATRARLVDALVDADPQRRFLAAWMLAFAGPGDAELETVVRTLIPILGDDHVPGNGMMAAEALRALGDRRTPWVMAALRYEEGQVKDMLFQVAGGVYAYRGSTARNQQARDVYLLGPSRAGDWAPHRLSPPADSAEARFRYLLDRMREVADGWVVNWTAEELVNWHRDALFRHLVPLLESSDRDTRQFAASLARRLDEDPAMPPQLYTACVEGLADDDLRWNALGGAYHLVQNYPQARLDLQAGLRSPDPVLRYRCAVVAACAGETDLASWVPTVVEALGDDDIVGNAIGASHLLAVIPGTRPWVEAALASPDRQLRAQAARVLAIQDRRREAGEPQPRLRVHRYLSLGRRP